jgi:radical SAM protein with 4Fe4S-binding SPASM domain
MGGEPFLYEDLGWFIKKIRSSKDQLVEIITIFTGGIFPTKNLDLLDGIGHTTALCLNLNEKKTYASEAAYNQVIHNLKTMIDKKYLSVGLSYNIASLDFNGDEIIETSKKFGINHLRIAIANPVYGSENPGVVHPKDYHLLAPKVFKFIKKCHANSIIVNLDCRIPLCFFTEKQIGWFFLHNQRISRGIQSCACGGGPLCVSPELEVSKCTVFHKKTLHLDYFSSVYDINGWVLNEIDHKFGIPDLYPKCATCPHRTRCSGGCPAWKKGFLDNPDEYAQLNEWVDLLNKNLHLYQQYTETKDNAIHDEFIKNGAKISKKFESLTRKKEPDMLYRMYLYHKMTGNSKQSRKYLRKAIHYGLNEKTIANFNNSGDE